MKAETKKTLIFGGVALGVAGFIIYTRNKNQKESEAILEYISQIPSQVDKSAATSQGIYTVLKTNFDQNRLHVIDSSGKDLYGKYSNSAMKNAISNIVVDLHKSISGAGTDTKLFFKTFQRIRNKNTMGFIDKIYKGMYGESLFEAMKGETALNSTAFGVFSDKTKNDLAIPLLSEGYWHPNIGEWINRISLYN